MTLWRGAALISVVCLVCGAQTPEAGSISGRVVNGVTGEPVRKATVRVSRLDGGQRRDRSVDCDAEGVFGVSQLAPGRYIVSASKTGFAASRFERWSSQLKSQQTVAVESGKATTGLKLELLPSAVVTGRVLDEDGEPKESTSVQVLRWRWQNGRRELLHVAGSMSNDLGEYRIHGLEPGSYLVSAVDPVGYSLAGGLAEVNDEPERAYMTTYYPGTVDVATAALLELQAGQELRGLDIRLMKTPVVRLAGRVVSGVTGQGVRAQVLLMPRNRSGITHMESRRGTAMGPGGGFELTAVTAGQYTLLATAREGDKQVTAIKQITVGDRAIRDLLLELRPGVTLKGTVKVDGGEAAKGSLSLAPLDLDSAAFSGGGVVPIAEDGTFTKPDLQPGRYGVMAFGQNGCGVKSVKAGPDDVTETGLDVLEGGGAGLLSVVMWRKCGTVAGKVADSQGQPVANAMVTLLPEQEALRSQMWRIQSATTGKDGSFELGRVTPGAYIALATTGIEPGQAADPEVVKQYEKSIVKVTVAEGQTETLQLPLKQP